VSCASVVSRKCAPQGLKACWEFDSPAGSTKSPCSGSAQNSLSFGGFLGLAGGAAEHWQVLLDTFLSVI